MGINFAPIRSTPSTNDATESFIRDASKALPSIRPSSRPADQLQTLEFICAHIRLQISHDRQPNIDQLLLLAEGTRLIDLARRRNTIDDTVTDLDIALRFAASELCSMGFERSMAFRNDGTELTAIATEFVAAPTWEADNHNHAVANPVPVRHDLFEASVMIEQVAAIINSPIEDVRAWQPIVTRLHCDGYVVAPILIGSTTVGTIHADCHFSQTALDEGHRDLIASLAISLSETLSRITTQPRHTHDELTRREAVVLSLVRRGMTNGQIATELCVSPETIKTHVARILRKLDVPNRTAAAAATFTSKRSGH